MDEEGIGRLFHTQNIQVICSMTADQSQSISVGTGSTVNQLTHSLSNI
jgi:hypothetical protein